jgi:hypothetical protein
MLCIADPHQLEASPWFRKSKQVISWNYKHPQANATLRAYITTRVTEFA